MKEIIATVSKRGQITLPAEVRRTLGIRPGDKVAFIIEGERVTVRPVEFTAKSVFSSVKLLNKAISVEEAIRLAKEERIKRATEKIRSH